MIRRREFITLLGGTAALPFAAPGQLKIPVIGYLSVSSPDDLNQPAAFRRGLSEAGFVEGQNVAIEYRWARGEPSRLAELAADLAARHVDLIAVLSGLAAAFARACANGRTDGNPHQSEQSGHRVPSQAGGGRSG
jgi:putative ABC transport system substrate-binding protein